MLSAMRNLRRPVLLTLLASVAMGYSALAADEKAARVVVDGSDVERELQQREQKIQALTAAERESLRLAHLKAAEDPNVREALERRDAAILPSSRSCKRCLVRRRARRNKVAAGSRIPMKRSFITVVSGLPRSGTSLMMQMLSAGGIPPLTDHIRSADESNPRGYYEFEAVKKLRADHSWLEHARGHAVKIIHALLRELPVDGRYEYRVLLMKRPIGEVLASQRAMLARSGKPSADQATLARIYQAQLEELDRWLAARTEFAVLPVEHHRALQSPGAVAGEIDAFLDGGLDTAAMAAAVDPSLYRERVSSSSE
jgi:hypothetical protein